MPRVVIDRHGQAREFAVTGIILYPMSGHGVPCPYVRTIFDVCILLSIHFVEGKSLARLLTATGRHGGLPLPE
jgi:tRNA A-37 threonylcarbamoyl transferase component Bud32